MIPRGWIAVWAVVCAAAAVSTALLNASASSGQQPEVEDQVRAECAELVADVERQLAKARAEREDTRGGMLAFSRVQVGGSVDCSDDLRRHFEGYR